jgi:hypothetical protein
LKKGHGVAWSGLRNAQDVENPGNTGYKSAFFKIKSAIEDGFLLRNHYFEGHSP